MGKRASTFKESDLARALKAAKKAGIDVQVEVDLEHKRMIITPLKANSDANANPWDEVLTDGAANQERPS